MRNLGDYLLKAAKMPPKKLIKKVFEKISIMLSNTFKRYLDMHFNTPLKRMAGKIEYSYIDINQLDISKLDKNATEYLCNMYLNHRFDLLGSGWVKVNYDINPLGLDDYKYHMSPKIKTSQQNTEWLKDVLLKPYIKNAEKILKNIDNQYEFIDWQMDFKSGFRWSAKKWYKAQRVGFKLGSDIKIPWELARLQHLPQMAIFSIVLPEYVNKLIKEFKNQVLDFIATNPPRMGVNWTCTMDVGIRAANILLAYDIFKQLDKNNVLDDKLDQIISKSMYEHGVHIVNNLEWMEEHTSNHYLSDICGLLFISAYLDKSKETNTWSVFAIQELITEMKKEFHEDGSNFEASTSYHRLSGELMIYSTALIYGMLKDKKIDFTDIDYRAIKRLQPVERQEFNINTPEFFPDWYLDRLLKSGCFTLDITKPNGQIVQIGDNDSGRFLKFSPVGQFTTSEEAIRMYRNLKGYQKLSNESLYWDEDILNHLSFISAVSGLYENKLFDSYAKEFPLEKSLVKALAKEKTLNRSYMNNRNNESSIHYDKLELSKSTILYECKQGISLLNNMKFICYPDFGIYIYKSDRLYLLISAGENGQNGNGGHAHNDKLSFELNIDGEDLFVDPGTYVYTCLPEKRNAFRSVKSHSTIIVDGNEQNDFLDAFAMKSQTRCHVINCNESSIKLYLKYKDVQHERTFNICENRVTILDRCNKKFEVNLNTKQHYSNGYGKLLGS